MSILKGIYIEDDKNNIEVTKAMFDFYEGIEIVSLDQLPYEVEEIYPMVIDHEADFLLIDHELNKQVGYTGIEALREIRKHDSTIYAVLLTNFAVEDFKEEFGEYDNELNKDELKNEDKMKEVVAKVKRACKLRKENILLGQIEKRAEIEKEKLECLKSIEEKLLKEQ